MKDLQKILSRVRAAVDRYDMIDDGDYIAVGVSGGKDSIALLYALSKMRSFYPKKYNVVAITIDMGFNHINSSHNEIKELCNRLEVEYIIKNTEIADVIFNIRKESNPCSLCSKMRRGILIETAKENGCNKLALGHHFDDAAETMMLNLFFEGRIGCFRPVTYLSKSNMFVIRPMILTEEKQIKHFIKTSNVNIEESICPENKETERENIKKLLHDLDRQHRGIYRRIVGALERGNIDGWKEK